jgi:hypothetical protein
MHGCHGVCTLPSLVVRLLRCCCIPKLHFSDRPQVYLTDAERVVLMSCFDTTTPHDSLGKGGTATRSPPRTGGLEGADIVWSYCRRMRSVSPHPTHPRPIPTPNSHMSGASMATATTHPRVGFQVVEPEKNQSPTTGPLGSESNVGAAVVVGKFAGSKSAVIVSLFGIHMMVRCCR